ncbi:aminotransferase class IV [Hymenobacter latericus]|uniref:aminotransferase class IV n=1 Tax=Hymenobacter sp. YIM 151858-1 TaxID=2987688 RepID=UPI002227C3A1|nr:aminotransferase class IV [Hymenobacter sp. YIM 151858-1]UYZ60022.1 aminotransferase class IV [Hymenobacter sp. YIM 151858-1]
MSYALLNGQLLPAAAVQLPLPNRGLQFNDGFFETLVLAGGQVSWGPQHLGRMQRAAEALHLELPAGLSSVAALNDTLAPLAATLAGAVRIRLQLWRAGGGLYAPATTQAEWLATAAAFVPHNSPIGAADFARSISTHYSPVSFCKGPYALHYVLAAQERKARALGELLLLDAQGHVAEAVSAAVFWISGNELFTPAPESGCVAGVRQAHLLQVAQRQGIRCHLGLYRPAALLAADAVFTANVAGIRRIEQLADVAYKQTEHPLLDALRQWDTQI